jgi:transposase
MEALPDRIMRCKSCNFSAHRDLVPMLWYLLSVHVQEKIKELMTHYTTRYAPSAETG